MVFCVSDEQYIGTLLSWKVGADNMDGVVIKDSAMAMVAPALGVPVDDVDMELLIEVRGSRSNLTHVKEFHDKDGECHASER